VDAKVKDILVDKKADDIVEVILSPKDILKASSMFYDRGIICFFVRNKNIFVGGLMKISTITQIS
jgi:hypothetical protein